MQLALHESTGERCPHDAAACVAAEPQRSILPHLANGGCRAADKAAAAEEKKRHRKNLKVLSFGDDVEEDDQDDLAPGVMKSAHDATKDPRYSRSK